MTTDEPGTHPPAAARPAGDAFRATPIGSRLGWSRAYRVVSYLRSSLSRAEKSLEPFEIVAQQLIDQARRFVKRQTE